MNIEQLANEYLIKRGKEWVESLIETGGKSWCLKIPVDIKNDPDVIFSEIIKRFEQQVQAKGCCKKE